MAKPKAEKRAAEPIILACSCKHAYQDRRYGAGRRLHNPVNKKENTYRCTVCKTEHTG